MIPSGPSRCHYPTWGFHDTSKAPANYGILTYIPMVNCQPWLATLLRSETRFQRQTVIPKSNGHSSQERTVPRASGCPWSPITPSVFLRMILSIEINLRTPSSTHQSAILLRYKQPCQTGNDAAIASLATLVTAWFSYYGDFLRGLDSVIYPGSN